VADVAVRPGVQHVGRVQASPPTTAGCEQLYKVACSVPGQTQRAYNLPALYRLAAGGARGIADVTTGNTTVSFRQGGTLRTVHGYAAGCGYDLASGRAR
jgi:hypothetical protein